ncbi:hypothetical protein [Caballeronia novacaledonica]|uniref:Uncharacterized protein n=1 Tax=Caballeronia novacaledonica TaxID=1544861 RepID=A0AA37MS96_9BURK|nr:hypothetical protein [Caballeronia novacaledonica]GJH25797.1 hypothetical protein CBA19CS42_14795 [Caballeronia novacaledonica]
MKWFEQSPLELALQGVKNGPEAPPGFGEGGPFGPSMATALATVESWIVPTSVAGSVPDNAILAGGGDKKRLPIPDTVTADNGLEVQSNPKHTPGMPGNRPNAGTEPANSLDLFNSSEQGGDGVRYVIDSSGNVNRLYADGNGVYHWSRSAGDSSAPLNVSKIPIDIKRSLGFKGK